MNLSGKTYVITGARRVGETIMQKLLWANATVVTTFSPGKKPVRKEASYEVDLSDELSIHRFFAQVSADYKRVDGLVNMASVYEKDPENLTFALLDRLMRINAYSAVLLSELFARYCQINDMLRSPIITFGDWAAEHPYPDYAAYLMAKSAVHSYMRSLQVKYRGAIRVITILPGLIMPPQDLSLEERGQILANTPSQTYPTPDDVASFCVHALTNRAIENEIYMDGGQHWRHRF